MKFLAGVQFSWQNNPREDLEKLLTTSFGRLDNFLRHNTPYMQGGFIGKKYISKYLKINKMGSIFWPVLQARGSKIRILMFGYKELDPPTVVILTKISETIQNHNKKGPCAHRS